MPKSEEPAKTAPEKTVSRKYSMNLLSKTGCIHYVPHTALKSMWKVEAEENYDVMRGYTKTDEYVAIRTIYGKGRIILTDSSEYDLDENTLYIIKRDCIKRYYCVCSKWRFNWFDFYCDQFITQISGRIFCFTVQEQEINCMNDCFILLGLNTGSASIKASSVFSQLITGWVDSVYALKDPQQISFESFISDIVHNLSKNYSIRELACSAKMCERSFRNAFIKYTSLSPKKYIEKRRLDAALELLSSTKLLIKDIAGMVGLSDQYYFSRIFAKQFGKSPENYRKTFA